MSKKRKTRKEKKKTHYHFKHISPVKIEKSQDSTIGQSDSLHDTKSDSGDHTSSVASMQYYRSDIIKSISLSLLFVLAVVAIYVVDLGTPFVASVASDMFDLLFQ